MSSPRLVLKHLNNPIKILSFSLHDLALYLGPFFLGSLFDSMFIIPVGGLLIAFTLKRLFKRLPRYYIIRFLYWTLPTSKYNRLLKTVLPPSNKRFWVR